MRVEEEKNNAHQLVQEGGSILKHPDKDMS
jgi:hypothetical protein